MEPSLESINRRLGQIEHLLNAVLEKQEVSVGTIKLAIELSTEQIERQIANRREEEEELQAETSILSEERRLADLRYLKKELEKGTNSMTKDEHRLIVSMLKNQTMLYAGLLEILKSRGIVEGDDLLAFDAAISPSRRKSVEQSVEAEYLSTAAICGVKTGLPPSVE